MTPVEAVMPEALEPKSDDATPKILESPENPVEKEPPRKQTEGLVKCRVLIGTVRFEQGTFERGEVFTVTEERAKLFSRGSVEFL